MDRKAAIEYWWLYAGVMAIAFHIWLAFSFNGLAGAMLEEKADLFLGSLSSSTEQTLQASHYLEERIVSSLKTIAAMIASAPAEQLSCEWLEGLRQKHDLKAISIYDSQGKVRLAHDPSLIGTDLPLDYGCHDILTGEKTEHVFGFSSGVFCETDAFGIALRLSDGGALRLLTGVDFVLGFEKNVGLVPLISRFRKYPGVKRLDLVDKSGRSLLGEAAAPDVFAGQGTIREFKLHDVPIGRFELTLGDESIEGLKTTGFLAILASCFFSLAGLTLLDSRLRRRSEIIEEKRREEDTRRRIEGFGRVVAAVAHEVRNPLNTMSLAVSATRADINEGRKAGDLEPRLELLEQTIRQADQMIRDLLQAGRPIVPQKRSIVLAEWLKQVADTFLLAFSGLEVSVHGDQACKLSADPDQLRQILWNLLLNARQAGADKIQLSFVQNRDGLQLIVSNNGPQISEEVMAGLFVPGNTTRHDGFGLGLYNCQRICTAHEARISVTSTPEKTSFTIFFPSEAAA